MSHISDIQWEGGAGLQELALWGAEGCRALADAAVLRIDSYGSAADDAGYLRHLLSLLEDRLEETQKKLEEFYKLLRPSAAETE